MPKSPTWIVKIGGALIGHGALAAWIEALAVAARKHRIIVVGGGGVFADTVRQQQSILAVDDLTAHHMALSAMRQFALALSYAFSAYGFAPSLSDLSSLQAARAANGLWLWDPCDEQLTAAQLPQDWTLSSDSLALWLCGELQAGALILVKHDAVLETSILADSVDAYFAQLRKKIASPVWSLGWSQSARLSALLSERGLEND